MISTSVSNNITKRITNQNAAQLSLWAVEPAPDEHTHTIPFCYADGDTSDVAAQRMLAQVTGDTRRCCGYEYVNGHLVTWYAKVLDAWIDAGVVYGRCTMTAEGPYVRAGETVENEEDL